MKILFILCEGSHDAQFLFRLLQASETYEDPKWKISEYPDPLPQFFKQNFQHQDLESIVIGEPTPLMVPAVALKRKDTDELVLIYKMGGESNVQYTLNLLEKLRVFLPSESDELRYYPGQGGTNEYAILFFYDADEQGRQNVLDTFIQRYSDHFEGLNGFNMETWEVNRGIPLGLFVFTGEGRETGTLEDTLIHLVSQKDESLVKSATRFIDDHSDHQQETVTQQAKRAKSILTSSGQTRKKQAGASLAVIVRHSAFLDDAFDFADSSNQWSRILKMIQTAFL